MTTPPEFAQVCALVCNYPILKDVWIELWFHEGKYVWGLPNNLSRDQLRILPEKLRNRFDINVNALSPLAQTAVTTIIEEIIQYTKLELRARVPVPA